MKQLHTKRKHQLARIAVATTLVVGAAWAAAAFAADPPSMAKTGTKYEADADMQAVLDELASMGSSQKTDRKIR